MSNVDQHKEVLERCFDDIAALKKAHKDAVEFSNDLLKENGSLQVRIAELEKDVQWYKNRCDELQEIQSRMRDPERQIVCDILANGIPRDKAGIGNYGGGE